MLTWRGPRFFPYFFNGEFWTCGLLCSWLLIRATRGVKAISPGRDARTTSELPRCRAATLFAPRPPYVLLLPLPLPAFASGLQSGSLAFSKPRGFCAGRVKFVVFRGEHLVANAEDTARDSPPAERGRSNSARSFASLDEMGRRRRLHREVVQGSSSLATMMMCVYMLINT
jgi:hypothetical protein